MNVPRVVLIGGGAMGGALFEGVCRAGTLNPDQWLVCEPDETRRGHFAARGAQVAGLAEDLVPFFSTDRSGQAQVLLAVKPQQLTAVGAAITGGVGDRVVISILAGTRSERVRAALGGACRVVRAMPNTPARVAQGVTALSLGAGARPGDEAQALQLFRAAGPVVERIDESLMDAFTAVAGSGPAYFFYMAEAMTRAAVELGFDPAVADRVVRQTALGAATLLSASAPGPAELRAAVTSKGGTTEAAVGVLDGGGVAELIVAAVRKACARGAELGR